MDDGQFDSGSGIFLYCGRGDIGIRRHIRPFSGGSVDQAPHFTELVRLCNGAQIQIQKVCQLPLWGQLRIGRQLPALNILLHQIGKTVIDRVSQLLLVRLPGHWIILK